MLKLPKGILSHPRFAEIEQLFAKDLCRLWSQGKLRLPQWEFTEQLHDALHGVALNGHLIQGLEAAAKNLEAQQRGLELLFKKTGETQSPRLSRLMILSGDGSERFYREVDSLLTKHSGRLWAVITDASSEDLGLPLVPQQKLVKGLMIDDRKALEQFLTALL